VAVRHARSINACGLIGPSIPLRYVSTELSQVERLHPECYRGRYLWFGRRGIDPGGWEGPDPWKYAGGVRVCFDPPPPKMSHSFIQNCYITASFTNIKDELLDTSHFTDLAYADDVCKF